MSLVIPPKTMTLTKSWRGCLIDLVIKNRVFDKTKYGNVFGTYRKWYRKRVLERKNNRYGIRGDQKPQVYGVRKKLMQPHHANYFQSRIKTRVQYYCADCGSFVSKETMNCKTCTEKNDPYLSSNSWLGRFFPFFFLFKKLNIDFNTKTLPR